MLRNFQNIEIAIWSLRAWNLPFVGLSRVVLIRKVVSRVYGIYFV